MDCNKFQFLMVLAFLSNVSLLVIGDGVINCFSCGYLELANGTRTEIEGDENVPFCGVDNLNETMNAPTEPAVIVRQG